MNIRVLSYQWLKRRLYVKKKCFCYSQLKQKNIDKSSNAFDIFCEEKRIKIEWLKSSTENDFEGQGQLDNCSRCCFRACSFLTLGMRAFTKFFEGVKTNLHLESEDFLPTSAFQTAKMKFFTGASMLRYVCRFGISRVSFW